MSILEDEGVLLLQDREGHRGEATSSEFDFLGTRLVVLGEVVLLREERYLGLDFRR